MKTGHLAIPILLGVGLLPAGACSDTHGPSVVALVIVAPAEGTLGVGDTLRLTAIVKDVTGNVLEGHPVSWKSGDPGTATVSATGLVIAVHASPLTAPIMATSENVTGYAS